MSEPENEPAENEPVGAEAPSASDIPAAPEGQAPAPVVDKELRKLEDDLTAAKIAAKAAGLDLADARAKQAKAEADGVGGTSLARLVLAVAKATLACKKAGDHVGDLAETLAAVKNAPPPLPTLWFGSVEEWVRCWLRWAWQHVVDGNVTCWRPDWWRLDEAVARLTVLWNGWEACRNEPGPALSGWWINHLDPHMAQLTSNRGPMRDDSDEVRTQSVHDPLPLEPLPPDHPLRFLEPHLAHLQSGCPGPYGELAMAGLNVKVMH